MYSNIYTFTQRDTHLVCQTHRKNIFANRIQMGWCKHWENKLFVSYCTRLRIKPVHQCWEIKGLFLSWCWRGEDEDPHAERWGVKRKAGGCLCSKRTNNVQNKNKDTLLYIFNSPTPGVDNETMFRGMFKKIYLFGVKDVSRKWAASQKRHRQMSRDEQLANSENVLGTWMAFEGCEFVLVMSH